MSKGEFNEEEAATVGGFMVSITKYLHKNEVIIRNMRPEGFMFQEADSLDIKLMDLTMALRKEDITGTEDYLFDEY